MIFFGRPSESGHVDDTGNASELATDLPILNRFQIRERGLAGSCEFISIDFGNRPPRRQRRRRPGRQLHRAQPIQYFLTVAKDLRVKIKIDLDVAQPKDRERANIREARHAIERDFNGNRDLAFDLFGRPPALLGDQLDHRRRGIGIGDNIEDMKGVEPSEKEKKAQDTDHGPLDQREFNNSGYHGV